MTDLSELEQQLTEGLAGRAAAASPPADGWDRIVARSFDDSADESDSDGIIEITPDELRAGPELIRHVRRWPLAVIGSAAAMIVAIVIFSSFDQEAGEVITNDEPEIPDADDAPIDDTLAPTTTTPPSDEVTRAGDDETADVDDPVLVAGLTLTWTQAQWGDDSGPLPGAGAIVATSFGFLGTNADGRLWRSADGASWEEDASILGLGRISVADAGSHVLVFGRRADGSMALMRSEDDGTWTGIELSALGADQAFELADATPSGLVWLRTDRGRFGAGVIAIIDGDRVVETYEPPWNTTLCCATVDLVELSGRVVAFQTDFNDPTFSVAYRYLGGGVWSDPVDLPRSGDHAQVGDAILMFDQTNATCCSDAPPAATQWPLLSSTDGINWTEIGEITDQQAFNMHIFAGRSFWIYAAGRGAGGLMVNQSLGFSQDGQGWQPIDISFARDGPIEVVGDTIILGGDSDGVSTVWIGTFSDSGLPPEADTTQ